MGIFENIRPVSASHRQHHGLWNLWELMLKKEAGSYIRLGALMVDMTAHFHIDRDSPEKVERLDTEFRKDLSEILDVCRSLGLSTSAALIEPRVKNIPRTQSEFGLLVEAINAELSGKFLLYIPPHLARYYEWSDIVSEKVIAAFPSASEEIRNAGSSLATGQNTACVFHCMRAAEIGLKAFGSYAKITLPKNKPLQMGEWREILDRLADEAGRLDMLPNSTQNKEADQHFHSEASAQFRFFKSAWRVRVAHARATYTEAEAVEVLNQVRSFFEILASRVTE